MANKIRFVLDGCDINFYAEAPEDITLKQLLEQCDKIEPDYCTCGIYSAERYVHDRMQMSLDDLKPEIIIDYDSIRTTGDNVWCKIVEDWRRTNG